MAENKKSIIVYADWQSVFNELDDNEAGQLIKHFFAYVNDENPIAPNKLIKIAFEPIRLSLKRDLQKWDEKKQDKSLNGRMGNLKRWNLDLYNKVVLEEITIDEAENIAKHRRTSLPDVCESHRVANIAVNDSVSVNVNDTVNVSVNDILLEKETKDIIKGKSLNLNPKIKDIEERRKDFNESLKPFFVQYGFQMMESFYNYWAELTMDKKKMRFEIQKTWETNLRLATWSKNNIKFNNNGTKQPISSETGNRKLTIDEQIAQRQADFERKLNESIENLSDGHYTVRY